MQWFRLYAGTHTDPKFRIIAKKVLQPVVNVYGVWVALLECASERDGDVTEASQESLAVTLDISEDEIRVICDAFKAREMIVNGKIAAWDKRQFKSDTSKTRTQAWRDRKKEAVTSPNRRVTRQNRTEQKPLTPFVGQPTPPSHEGGGVVDGTRGGEAQKFSAVIERLNQGRK